MKSLRDDARRATERCLHGRVVQSLRQRNVLVLAREQRKTPPEYQSGRILIRLRAGRVAREIEAGACHGSLPAPEMCHEKGPHAHGRLGALAGGTSGRGPGGSFPETRRACKARYPI